MVKLKKDFMKGENQNQNLAKLLFINIAFLFCLIFTVSSQDIAAKYDKEIAIKIDKGTLYGSLLVPKSRKKIPVVLLIPGSGPTDRNCNNYMGLSTNSFIYLSEALFKKGIASLRVDKRTSGKSIGTFKSNIKDIKFDDFISDAKLWIDTLKKDNRFSRLIVAGHSQGSLVGLVASREKKIDKFISISGAGRSIDQILLDQFNVSFPEYADSTKMFLDSLKHGVYMKNAPLFLKQSFAPYLLPFMKQWFSYEPSSIIGELKCPVLIVNGDNDIQVPTSEALLLHNANKKSKLLIVPEMNHILKNAPRDRLKNMQTYYLTDIPLNKEFVKKTIKFIKKK